MRCDVVRYSINNNIWSTLDTIYHPIKCTWQGGAVTPAYNNVHLCREAVPCNHGSLISTYHHLSPLINTHQRVSYLSWHHVHHNFIRNNMVCSQCSPCCFILRWFSCRLPASDTIYYRDTPYINWIRNTPSNINTPSIHHQYTRYASYTVCIYHTPYTTYTRCCIIHSTYILHHTPFTPHCTCSLVHMIFPPFRWFTTDMWYMCLM